MGYLRDECLVAEEEEGGFLHVQEPPKRFQSYADSRLEYEYSTFDIDLGCAEANQAKSGLTTLKNGSVKRTECCKSGKN